MPPSPCTAPLRAGSERYGSPRSARRRALAALTTLVLALGACGGDDGGDDDASTTTTTTTEADDATTTEPPSTTEEPTSTSDTTATSDTTGTSTDGDPGDDTATVPAQDGECPSSNVATALVQAGSSFTGATVIEVVCDGPWAVATLALGETDPGVAHLRYAGGAWSVGFAGSTLEAGCDYAHANGAPASILADCP
ncbi:MAG: hypothetical protein GXY13_02610 [Acidimicrobiales bacterium]|nr:hypothetical protein [Acidimicrobiales bacterium]